MAKRGGRNGVLGLPTAPRQWTSVCVGGGCDLKDLREGRKAKVKGTKGGERYERGEEQREGKLGDCVFVLACGLVLSVVGVVIKRGSFVFTTAMPMEIRRYGYLDYLDLGDIALRQCCLLMVVVTLVSFSLRPSCVCGP